MIRRHRPARDIPFTFDSFLDLVANVVGVIIRLILVVWVGARSYHAVKDLPTPPPSPTPEVVTLGAPPAPPRDQLDRQHAELTAAQARLLEEIRRLQQTQAEGGRTTAELQALAARRQQLEQEQAALAGRLAEGTQAAGAAALSAAELRQRFERLTEELRGLEKLPSAKRVLRYRTPVSQEVRADELMFECRRGRVTFVPLQALTAEVERDIRDNKDPFREQLRRGVPVERSVGPVGPFRMRYLLERQTSILSDHAELTSAELEPAVLERGEALARALAAGSDFRHIVDVLDPQYATVTFWVYPDSFPLYRALRDYLSDRGIEVAGRPLPEGEPIGFSKRGTRSRGQ
jgi:hypothetical protein